MRNVITAVILGTALLSACVAPPKPGAQEGPVPPRLYLDNNMKTWEHVSSFGPVPAAQAALGAETCAKLNTMDLKFVAAGYHSQAQGLDGRTLPGGGFYCVRQ